MNTGTSLASADWSGAVFCATRCYACQFGEHPGVPHTWGAPDDFEHAWATFQAAPGFCGCECGRPPRTPPKVRVRRMPVLRIWSWNCPGCARGASRPRDAHAAVLADAIKHRESDSCKWRGVKS